MISLIAQSPAALDTPQVRYAWEGAAELFAGRTLALLAALAIVLLLGALVYVTRREIAALAPRRWAALLVLRTLALLGLAALIGGLERRVATEEVRPSRVAIVIDSSLSMALVNDSATPASRFAAAQKLLSDSPLADKLRELHQLDWLHVSAALAPLENSVVLSQLNPRGGETRLGDALATLLDQSADTPLAGIVLLSDGRSNAGAPALAAAELAKSRGVPIHTVGFGPTTAPPNLWVRDFQTPGRVFTGDEFTLTALVSLEGASLRSLTCRLYRRIAEEDNSPETLVDEKTLPLKNSKEPVAIRFRETLSSPGEYLYRVEVGGLGGETILDDNGRIAKVEVVDQVVRTLLVASGPSRDFLFLRNQLRREQTFEVKVLLTSGGELTEESLAEFPETAAALAEFDAVAAFDANWSLLDAATQANLVRWIGDEAGGLLVAPGPVQTPRLLQRRKLGELARVLPVEFGDGLALMAGPRGDTGEPRPVQLTRAGAAAEFLELATAEGSAKNSWEDFPGFYGVFPVTGAKPGATLYATLAPQSAGAEAAGDLLFAEQFYGAGRVFYVGTNELWRLRGKEPDRFTGLFTKLLRHISQGRLARGSAAGRLAFERPRYEVGDSLTLRAALRQRAGAALPTELVAQVAPPTGEPQSVTLSPQPAVRNVFEAQLSATDSGVVRATATLPTGETLEAETTVALPLLESGDTLRDEPLLKSLAKISGGLYFPTPAGVLANDCQALVVGLPSREETVVSFGAPDAFFARRWAWGCQLLAAGAMIVGWLLRRWWSLA